MIVSYIYVLQLFVDSRLAHVEVPASLLATPAVPGQDNAASSSSVPTATSLTKEKRKKHHLTTSTDPLLVELRDLNFSSVGRKLNQVARRLDDDYKVCLGVFSVQIRSHTAISSGIKRRL